MIQRLVGNAGDAKQSNNPNSLMRAFSPDDDNNIAWAAAMTWLVRVVIQVSTPTCPSSVLRTKNNCVSHGACYIKVIYTAVTQTTDAICQCSSYFSRKLHNKM